ncbi:flagellar hook-basal body complex protein FliE [Parvibaculum sp.]|uniref:flagellar hook-basal body complex protein FliE n=1 Tax=Parvibaculum sp. TaxID=2024848 RepID=UPI000C937381|nr:flagellar hook-basal body complex protein FliE [Parvibaculum sp.]MAB15535.1 flagellar hook-basal body complex protein FliE [Parvibaculum sp.]
MATPASLAMNAYARAAGMASKGPQTQGPNAGQAAGGFDNMLKSALDEAVDTGKASEQKVAAMTGARQGNLVDVVTAVSEAEATLQTVVTVRDKVISAYQEILRMPI